MNYLLLIPLYLTSICAIAGDIDKIAGKYVYTQYQVSTPSGKKLGLADLGAKTVALEIRANSTIVMHMTMLNGGVVTTTADVSKTSVGDNSGYWIAQWPDMNYPVRSDFKFDSSVLTYEIRFRMEGDSARYGMTERATLVRQK